jgi:RNA polymerase sigma-70 factor (ECF subfamily)
VAAGERQAIEQCLDRFGGLVWSLARRYCPNAADAEDAVQEIFTEIWTSAGRYDPAVASETTFVAMIARRRLIDQQRKQARRPRHESLDPAIDQPAAPEATSLEIDEQVERVQRVIKTLRPEQQEALRLSIYDNCSHAEIAHKLDMPLGTVKTNIRRGLQKIRTMLDETSI